MAKLRRASSRTDRPLGHPTQLLRGDLDRLVAYRRTISPNTATPAVKITNSKSAILNSRLVLMSGYTALAPANSTTSHLFLEMNLATDSPRADSQRPVRHVQPNDSDRVPARWASYARLSPRRFSCARTPTPPNSAHAESVGPSRVAWRGV